MMLNAWLAPLRLGDWQWLHGLPLGELGVLGQHVGDTRVGRRPPRLVVSNVTEVEAFSWSIVMRGSLSRAG